MTTTETKDRDIEFIGTLGNDAWKDGEALASDERIEVNHRIADVKARFEKGIAAIQNVHDVEMRVMAEAETKLKPLAYVSPAPPPEQLAAVNYIRDLLPGWVSELTEKDFADKWTAALEAGDTITAIAFKDHLSPLMIENAAKTKTFFSGVLFRPLIERTETAVMSEAQRTARQELEKITVRRIQIGRAAAAQRERLADWRLQGNQLVERRRATVTL